jgi:hypothetical protein
MAVPTSLRRRLECGPDANAIEFTPSSAGTTIRAKYDVLTTYRLFVVGP